MRRTPCSPDSRCHRVDRGRRSPRRPRWTGTGAGRTGRAGRAWRAAAGLGALALSAAVTGVGPAAAHDGNVGLSEIQLDGSRVRYDLYLDARQLSLAIPLGPGGEVALTGSASGVTVRRADVAQMVADGLIVENGGTRAQPSVVALDATDTSRLTQLGGVSLLGEIPLLHVGLDYAFPAPVADYRIEYRLFMPDKATQAHSNLAWIHEGGRTSTFVFAPGGPPLVPGAAQQQPDPDGAASASRTDRGDSFPVWITAVTAVAATMAIGAAVALLRRPRAAAARAGRASGRHPRGPRAASGRRGGT